MRDGEFTQGIASAFPSDVGIRVDESKTDRRERLFGACEDLAASPGSPLRCGAGIERRVSRDSGLLHGTGEARIDFYKCFDPGLEPHDLVRHVLDYTWKLAPRRAPGA